MIHLKLLNPKYAKSFIERLKILKKLDATKRTSRQLHSGEYVIITSDTADKVGQVLGVNLGEVNDSVILKTSLGTETIKIGTKDSIHIITSSDLKLNEHHEYERDLYNVEKEGVPSTGGTSDFNKFSPTTKDDKKVGDGKTSEFPAAKKLSFRKNAQEGSMEEFTPPKAHRLVYTAPLLAEMTQGLNRISANYTASGAEAVVSYLHPEEAEKGLDPQEYHIEITPMSLIQRRQQEGEGNLPWGPEGPPSGITNASQDNKLNKKAEFTPQFKAGDFVYASSNAPAQIMEIIPGDQAQAAQAILRTSSGNSTFTEFLTDLRPMEPSNARLSFRNKTLSFRDLAKRREKISQEHYGKSFQLLNELEQSDINDKLFTE